MSETNYSYQQLYNFTKSVFLKIGCSDEHATTASTALLSADLRGVDSHGIARLSGYVRLWELQRVNATPVIKVIHETPSTAVVDGNILAEMVYSKPAPDKIIIEHTEVSEELSGKGVGLKLVLTAVEFARQHKLKIVPLCTFTKAVFDKKPELHDVLYS